MAKESIKKQAAHILGKHQINLIIFKHNLGRVLKNLDIFKDSKLKKGPLKIATNSLHGQINRQCAQIERGLTNDTLGAYKYINDNQELFTECFDLIYQCTTSQEITKIHKVIKAMLDGHAIHIEEKED